MIFDNFKYIVISQFFELVINHFINSFSYAISWIWILKQCNHILKKLCRLNSINNCNNILLSFLISIENFKLKLFFQIHSNHVHKKIITYYFVAFFKIIIFVELMTISMINEFFLNKIFEKNSQWFWHQLSFEKQWIEQNIAEIKIFRFEIRVLQLFIIEMSNKFWTCEISNSHIVI